MVARRRLAEHSCPFVGSEFAPSARWQVGNFKLSDSHADQTQSGMPDGGGDAADLPVFSLDELEGEPAVGDIFPEANRRIARWNGGRGVE